MLESKLEWACNAKLNDLFYAACKEYTMYMQTGNQTFKENAQQYFDVYKRRGGKRAELHMV